MYMDGAQMVKNMPTMQRPSFGPWVMKIPWRRAWQHDPVFLPGESHATEEPGRLQSMGLQRAGQWLSNFHTFMYGYPLMDMIVFLEFSKRKGMGKF